MTLEQFFNLVFPTLVGFIEIRAIAPEWNPIKPRIVQRFAPSVCDALDVVDSLHDSKRNIYFGILPRSQSSGRAESIIQASTLWVDIDIKTVGSMANAKANLKSLEIQPSIVVESGHGLHGYWLLETPTVELDVVRAVNRSLAASCGGDTVSDLPRVLRVPNTLNWKDERNPKICRVLTNNHTYHHLQHFPQAQVPFKQTPNARYVRVLSSAPTDLSRLSPVWQSYVKSGLQADRYNYYQGDRSRLDMAVVCQMVSQGFNDDEIFSTFTDPANTISEKTLSRTDGERYVIRMLDKARNT